MGFVMSSCGIETLLTVSRAVTPTITKTTRAKIIFNINGINNQFMF